MSEQEYGSDLAMSFPKKKRHVPVNISCRARWGIIRVSYIARQKYSWNEIRENRGAVRAILWTLLWRSVFEYSGWDKSALRDAQEEYKKGSNVLYAVLWNFIYFYLPRNDNTASRARIITAARVSAVRILIRARARAATEVLRGDIRFWYGSGFAAQSNWCISGNAHDPDTAAILSSWENDPLSIFRKYIWTIKGRPWFVRGLRVTGNYFFSFTHRVYFSDISFRYTAGSIQRDEIYYEMFASKCVFYWI